MRLIPLRTWLLMVASALLQFAIFPIAGPVPAWRAGLAWVALVPFLLAILGNAGAGRPPRVRQAALAGYVCGVLWYALNCYWIYQTMYLYGGLPKPVAGLILVLFALYLGLYHAGFAALLAWVSQSRVGLRGGLLLSPFLWVAVELARGRITGFPWDLLGYTQVDSRVATAVAPLAGVIGVSFVVASLNAVFAGCLLDRGRVRSGLMALAACGAIACALLDFSGAHRVPAGKTDGAAVLLQENLEVGAIGRAAQPVTPEQEMASFSALTLRAVRDGFSAGGKRLEEPALQRRVSVVVWPEAPSHLQSNQPVFREAMGELARAAQAPAIIGSLGVDFSLSAARGYFLYDSASLFEEDGSYRGRYDKMHLVPWGEYVPFKQFFAFAQKLTEGVGDMDRGSSRTPFVADGRRYGIFVCYESIFGEEVSQFARNGAEVFVNISDDGWYGDTGAPWQHLNMTRMRAIENARWVLLDTNTGITTSIDPFGRTTLEAPRHVRGAYVFPFSYARGLTFYTRFGDWFAWLCVVVTASGATFAGWERAAARRSKVAAPILPAFPPLHSS